MFRSYPKIAFALVAMLSVPLAAMAQTYSFASQTFDQSDTPDSGFGLSAGTYSGAVVTAFPSTAASVTGFPTSTAGFDSAKSVGRLVGVSSTSTRALNLPNGNNGVTARSGFLLSWSGGRKLQNLAGDDLVIYESGSTSTAPEGMMIQVFDLGSDSWSSWHYEPAETFQLYTGEPSEGAFATAIDLSDLGVGDGVGIDRLRIVNLTDEDRMQDPSGIGVVLPEDNGTTSTVHPDPGPLASFTMFSATTLDPDPLYVAALHSPPSNACGNGAVEMGEQCDPGVDAVDDCCDGSCQLIADATPCDDGLYCTLAGACSAGACVVSPRDCTDSNACTQDSCDESADQCLHLSAPLDGSGCDDTLFCTIGDTCQGGNCTGAPNTCGDSNACTQDSCDESGDQCLNDAVPLEDSSCDDGDVCTASSTCTAGSCAAGPLVLVCGDGEACGAEQCDDGNAIEGDGCSSTCQVEFLQSRQQKNCIKLLNSAGSLVARTQGKAALECLKNASRGDVPDAQACLDNDPSGRVGKSRNKTSKVHARSCLVAPDFSVDDVDVVNDAAVDETIALVGDVFGGDLGDATLLAESDPSGAKCQSAVVKVFEKLAAAKRREFILCKSIGLDSDTIRSAASLELCLDAIAADGRGKVLAAKIRMADAIAAKCEGVSLSAAFPGDCAAAPDLGDCIDQRVSCRVCRMFNRMDALSRDCDVFDDGNANDSCPD